MGYRVRFGDYDFPITLLPVGASSQQNRAAQPRRRASGSITQVGRRTETHLPIRGNLTAATPGELNTIIADLKAAVYAGKQPLWYGDDATYYRDAQLEPESVAWGGDGTAHGVWAAVSLLFLAADYPEAFSAAVTDFTFPSAAGGTITVSGDAPTQPLWTITIGSGGTGVLTLTNAATGEAALLDPGTAGWATGDVITLNRDTTGFSVKRNGVAAFGLLDFRIPSLVPGANAVTLSKSVGATAVVASLAARYQGRLR